MFEFYSRATSKETRAQYIVDNFVKYFNEDHPIDHSTPHKPEYYVHFATDPDLGDDLYV